jgi:pimeloyl-ACP methyl ester carboxylesterase
MAESPETRTLRLPDGRTLAYTDHGDPNGKPVIFIHGNPGSRFVRHPDERITEELGARIITPDRPGYGLSDFQIRRTIRHLPDDIVALADSLGFDRFAVMGVSAGGPYALACAHDLPERVSRAAVISGVSPLDHEDAYDGMHETYQAAFKATASLPGWLVRFLVWTQTRSALRDPALTLDKTASILSPADQELLSTPGFREQVMAYRPESARNGVKGIVREITLLVSPWGFTLEDIQTDIDLWYWEKDVVVPQQMGRHLESRLPNAHAHFLPHGGHFSIFTHWRDILAPLVEAE